MYEPNKRSSFSGVVVDQAETALGAVWFAGGSLEDRRLLEPDETALPPGGQSVAALAGSGSANGSASGSASGSGRAECALAEAQLGNREREQRVD